MSSTDNNAAPGDGQGAEAALMFAAIDSGEWLVTKNQEDPNLTLEWLAENLWLVKRNVRPFCDDEGRRTWGGPTVAEALAKACAALKVAAPSTATAAREQEGAESYESIWNALQRIDSAAAMLPTYLVRHEGGIDAFTQNIIDALASRPEAPAAPSAEGKAS